MLSFVFHGFGLGVSIMIWRSVKDKLLPKYQDSPWLLNDKWQSASIRSDSKTSMWFALSFTVVWNLLSVPLSFIIYSELVEKENYLLLVFLPFPLVGIVLLVWAFRRTREWRRFGAAPVLLDPFPGAIGGHVGGTIDIRLPFDPHNRFDLTLSCLQCSETGSVGNRMMHEEVQWQGERIAQVQTGPAGTRLRFCFDVPEGLSESDAEQTGDRYNLWRLSVHASLPGTDFDRSFNIPVYATASDLET